MRRFGGDVGIRTVGPPPIRVASSRCGGAGRVQSWPGMDADDQLLRTGAFVECVFHCVECGLGGTSLIRPAAIREKVCLECGGDVVVTVFERFRPSGSHTSDSEA
jgi:hypothetical protein